MKLNFKNLLENKVVLYIVFFLTLATIFGYMVLNNYAAVLFFILIAFLTNYFSKNMIVILGCAILGTHLLAVLDVFNNVREGFKEGNTSDQQVDDATTDENAGDDEDKTDDEDKPDEDNQDEDATTVENDDGIDGFSNKKAKNKKKGKNKNAFTNMNPLNPADVLPNIDNILTRGDKAKAKERAYDIVEEKLGKNNFETMNTDTKELIQRQKELMEEMKKITPILSQTMGMVGNMDLSSLTSMFDKVSGLLPSTEK